VRGVLLGKEKGEKGDKGKSGRDLREDNGEWIKHVQNISYACMKMSQWNPIFYTTKIC
jgi:hypothetical protein